MQNTGPNLYAPGDALPDAWLPARLNSGPWLVNHSAPELMRRIAKEEVILPICGIGTPLAEVSRLGSLVLPPLYLEAMDQATRRELVARIQHCFPFVEGSPRRRACPGRLRLVELPAAPLVRPERSIGAVAFSADTAVEEHGPHLPLATDQIQSYAILQHAATGLQSEVVFAPPLSYGTLVWGLAYGLSVDVPPALLTRYLQGYIESLVTWLSPRAVYLADVHGSKIHRDTLQDALATSAAPHGTFRWLHDPLVPWGNALGDAHAGALETVMIEHIGGALVDSAWWPSRAADLASHQVSLKEAIEMPRDLAGAIERGQTGDWNGIVGRIENHTQLSGADLFWLAVATAKADLAALVGAK